MKYLYLLRHAKSSWEFAVSDWNRPLSERGITDAEVMSQVLKRSGQQPELIVSSNAARALQTAAIFHQTLQLHNSAFKVDKSLYMSSIKRFNTTLSLLPEAFNHVMIVSHNPLLTNFFNMVIDHEIDNIPTSGLAVIRFDVDLWNQLGNSAELIHFEYPKKYK